MMPNAAVQNTLGAEVAGTGRVASMMEHLPQPSMPLVYAPNATRLFLGDALSLLRVSMHKETATQCPLVTEDLSWPIQLSICPPSFLQLTPVARSTPLIPTEAQQARTLTSPFARVPYATNPAIPWICALSGRTTAKNTPILVRLFPKSMPALTFCNPYIPPSLALELRLLSTEHRRPRRRLPSATTGLCPVPQARPPKAWKFTVSDFVFCYAFLA
jgi:hypothetical protein